MSSNTQAVTPAIEILYKDLLERLGVPGYDKAVLEINALRAAAGFGKYPNEAVAIVRQSGPIDLLGNTVKAAFLIDTTLPPDTPLYTRESLIRSMDEIQGIWDAAVVKQLLNPATLPAHKPSRWTKIVLNKQNRMLRLGFGKNEGRWFARIDLWFRAFRFTF